MAILDQIKGHQALIQQLESAQFSQRFASTQIFSGNVGIGKKQVALGLVQNILCEQNKSFVGHRACGRCSSCRRVEIQQHESLLLISPEKNQIKIEQARMILQFCHLKPIDKATIVLIDDVEMINVQAANALLKILEEPASQVYFVMICNVLGRLLPTLRSRSQIWHFRPLSFQEMKSLTLLPDWVISASQGSLETAKSLTDVEEDIKPYITHWLESFTEKPIEIVLEEARKIFSEKSKILNLARLWQQLVRDAMVYKIQPEFVIHRDSLHLLRTLSHYSTEQLHQWFNQGQILEASVFRHWDVQVLSDHLVYESYKCLRGVIQ